MKIRIIIITIIVVVIVLVLLLYVFIRQNTGIKDIATLLMLPIKEEQIVKIDSRKGDDSTTLIIYIDQSFIHEKLPLVDIAYFENTVLGEELIVLIKENGMRIDNVEIKENFVSYEIKESVFSSVVIDKSFYIITENHKNTIIFATIPNGVVLPREYRPQ